MSIYDPIDQFGIIPEIPTPSDLHEEPTEHDIAAAHLMGCLYAIAASVVLFIAVCLIILITHALPQRLPIFFAVNL